MSLEAGTRLGAYEILGLLGTGGMGEVYKARDTRLDRSVALKVLPGESDDPERRARFEREARTIGALNHPNICTLHDVGVHDGAAFLVMELLAGQTRSNCDGTRCARNQGREARSQAPLGSVKTAHEPSAGVDVLDAVRAVHEVQPRPPGRVPRRGIGCGKSAAGVGCA